METPCIVRTSQPPTVRGVTTRTDAPPTGPTRASGRTSEARTKATQVLNERTQAASATAGPLVLDRYRLHKRLGAGAFGTVWAARDERLERDVAIKIVPRERVIGGRFEREARAAARLSHPAIVTLYEAAVDDEGAYLVSELVRGGTLHKALVAGRLSDREILRSGVVLCEALDHAHGEGVIHRDVKPSNILLPPRSGKNAQAGAPAKLTDFGVARVIGGDSLTRTGDVLGTAAYMSPEQAEGLAVGPESDLYSLALVIYEALSGVNPLHMAPVGRRSRRLGMYLPPLRRQRRDLPGELGAGVDRALRPRPGERGTIAELHEALALSIECVGDQRGVVAAPWRPAMKLTDTRRTRQQAEQLDGERRLWGVSSGDGAGTGGSPPGRRSTGARRSTMPPPVLDFDDTLPMAIPRLARGAAGAGAAGIALWIGSRGLLPHGPPAAAEALMAGLIVMVLPTIGYAVLAVVACGAAAAAGHAGATLVLAIMLALPVALMPRRGVAWPLPAGAVALGLTGLGGAWPAAAGRLAGSLWRRAVVGACGPLWLSAAGAISGRDLYVRLPRRERDPLTWIGSVGLTVHHVLASIASPPVLAAAGVWGLAAAVVPWLAVRPSARPIEVGAVLVMVWAGATVAATGAALTLGHQHRAPSGGTLVLGGVACAAVALWPALARIRHHAAESGGAEP